MNAAPYGILLLASLWALGRDGRSLPVFACVCAIALAQLGWVGGLAGIGLLLLNLGAWASLRRLAPAQDRSAARHPGALAAALLMAIAAIRACGTASPRTGLVVAAVLASLTCVASASDALVGCAAMLRALDACVVLAGIAGVPGAGLVAAGLWVAVAGGALVVLPRLSWLRTEDWHD